MSLKIKVNNQEVTTEAANIQQLAEQLNLPEKGVALAVNNRVIPRANWAVTALEGGENIVVIKAAFGG